MIRRLACVALLGAITALRLWASVLGIAQFVPSPWAIALTAALVACGWLLPLRIAAFWGATAALHWPPVAALLLAAPRLLLMLPGLTAAWLASRRHPRPRWSRPETG